MKKGLILLLVITLVFTLLATFNQKEKETIVEENVKEEKSEIKADEPVYQDQKRKTNLVEAVMLTALTKSPRTSRDDDMKKENTDNTSVELCVEHSFGDVNVLVTLSKDEKKSFFINKNDTKKTRCFQVNFQKHRVEYFNYFMFNSL